MKTGTYARPHAPVAKVRLANVRLGYDTDRWRATVYADNLFDEGYHALIVPGVGHAAPGAPRTLGVEVVMKR